MRLNDQRQSELEPKRIKSCLAKLHSLGYENVEQSDCELLIRLDNGNNIKFFPYSGWYSGKKPIGSGRGFNNLLKALKRLK